MGARRYDKELFDEIALMHQEEATHKEKFPTRKVLTEVFDEIIIIEGILQFNPTLEERIIARKRIDARRETN